MYAFRWNDWNVAHIARRGIDPDQAEWVVNHAKAPYPEERADSKLYVAGQTRDGRWIQVVFVDDAESDSVYVIHARDLTEPEKRRYRRRMR